MTTDQKLLIEIDGNTVKLDRSLKSINAALSHSKREAAALSRELQTDPTNTTLLAQRQKELSQAMALSTEKAKMLRDQLANIDPDVDPATFVKLQRQLATVNRETNSFSRQLNTTSATLNRLNSTARTFQFDPGTGIKQFQNSVAGVDAALSSLGKVSDLVNFNRAAASTAQVQKNFNDIEKATELLNRKVTLLEDELKDIDVALDPSGYSRVQNQINAVRSQIQQLDAARVSVPVSVVANNNASGDSGTSKIRESVSNIMGAIGSGLRTSGKAVLNSTGQILTSIGGVVKSAAVNIASVAGRAFSAIGSTVTKAMLAPITKLGTLIPTALMNVVKGPVLNVAKSIGTSISNAVTAPFNGIKNALNTIIQGGLLTIGNKITSTVTSTFQGVTKSMQETVRSSKALTNVLSFTGVNTDTIASIRNEMADFAKKTTFSSSSLNKVIGGLSAAGVEADKTAGLTKNIASAYALLGDGSRDIADIGVIFSQINSATKLMSQDFNQLRDAGIGGALKKEIEKSFPDIIAQYGSFAKAMEEGAIKAEMVNQAIASIGSSDAASQAATVPKTIGEAFETMQETLGQKFQGVFDEFNAKGIDTIQNITSAIEDFDISGVISKISTIFSSLNGFRSAIINVLSKIDFNSVFNSLVNTLNNIATVWKNVFSSDEAKTMVNVLSSTLSKAFSALSKMSSNTNFVEPLINSLKMALRIGTNLIQTFVGVGSAFAKIFSRSSTKIILGSIGSEIEGLSSKLSAIANSEGFSTMISKVSAGFVILLSIATKVLNAIGGILQEVFTNESIQSFVSNIVVALATLNVSLSKTFSSDRFKEFINRTLSTLGNVLNSVISLFTSLGKVIGDTLNDPIFVVSVESLINSFDFLYNAIERIGKSEGFARLAQSILNIVSVTAAVAGRVVSTISTVLSNVFDSEVMTQLSNVADSFVNRLVGINTALSSNTSITILTEAFKTLVGYLTQAWEIILILGDTIGNALVNAFSDSSWIETFNVVNESIQTILGSLKEVAESKFVSSLVSGIVDVLQPVLEGVVIILAQLVDIVVNLFSGIDFTAITDPIQGMIGILKAFLVSFLEPIKKVLDDLKANGSLDSLWEGLAKLGKTLKNLYQILEPVYEFLGKVLGFFVGAMLEFIIAGISDFINLLNDLAKMFESIFKAIGKVGSDVLNWLSGVLGFSSYSGNSGASAYTTYSTVGASTYNSSSISNATINVYANPGMDVSSLARQIRHEFSLGIA